MYSPMQRVHSSKINNHLIQLRVVGLTGDVHNGEGARGLLSEKDALSPMTGCVLRGRLEVEAITLDARVTVGMSCDNPARLT